MKREYWAFLVDWPEQGKLWAQVLLEQVQEERELSQIFLSLPTYQKL
jgi:hypothetical protein